MELHRNGRTDRSLALKGIGIASGALLFAALGLVIGGSGGGFLLVLGGIVGIFILVVSVLLLALSFRPFRISFSETGVSVACEGLSFDVPWNQVDGVNIERLPTEEERYSLVVWVADSVPMKEQPTFPPGGSRKGYAVVELNQLQESREEIARILATYAGPKFATPAPRP